MAYRKQLVAVFVLATACGGKVLGASNGDAAGGGTTTADGSTIAVEIDGGVGVGIGVDASFGHDARFSEGGVIRPPFPDASFGFDAPVPPVRDASVGFDAPIIIAPFQDAGFGFDAGGFFDAGSFDGGTGAAFDAESDGGPSPFTGIACGNLTCNLSLESEQCCISLQGGSLSCVAEGTCDGVALSCSSSANCSAGEVCCASLNGGAPSATCQASCGGGFGGGGVQLCGSNSDCPAGSKCRETPLGINVCRGQGGGGGGGGGGGFGG